MQIFLFRHGQTASNAANKYVGRTDEPLCELGIAAAQAAGSDPSVREVMVTPLIRTQMTAAILFPNARQILCPGLREMDFGDFEGRSAQQMSEDQDYRYWVEQTQCMGPCPHGEARLVFQHRVCAAFREIVDRAQAEGVEKLYFVVHGGTIMSVMSRFARPEAPYFSWRLKNCQGYAARVQGAKDTLALTDVRRLEKAVP